MCTLSMLTFNYYLVQYENPAHNYHEVFNDIYFTVFCSMFSCTNQR